MTSLDWWVEHWQASGTAAFAVMLACVLVRHHLHVVYRISGRGGVKRRCGITRARRYRVRMSEYRRGRDRGSRSWEWRREVWCWFPVPYRLLRLVGNDGWLRRCVTVQFVWGRDRVLVREEAEIKRVLAATKGVEPTHNVQHTGRRQLAPQKCHWWRGKVAA